jgi:hypothetical protein
LSGTIETDTLLHCSTGASSAATSGSCLGESLYETTGATTLADSGDALVRNVQPRGMLESSTTYDELTRQPMSLLVRENGSCSVASSPANTPSHNDWSPRRTVGATRMLQGLNVSTAVCAAAFSDCTVMSTPAARSMYVPPSPKRATSLLLLPAVNRWMYTKLAHSGRRKRSYDCGWLVRSDTHHSTPSLATRTITGRVAENEGSELDCSSMRVWFARSTTSADGIQSRRRR